MTPSYTSSLLTALVLLGAVGCASVDVQQVHDDLGSAYNAMHGTEYREAISTLEAIVAETEPGTWTRVQRSASGKRSQKTSRTFSPPLMPVSQS